MDEDPTRRTGMFGWQYALPSESFSAEVEGMSVAALGKLLAEATSDGRDYMVRWSPGEMVKHVGWIYRREVIVAVARAEQARVGELTAGIDLGEGNRGRWVSEGMPEGRDFRRVAGGFWERTR